MVVDTKISGSSAAENSTISADVEGSAEGLCVLTAPQETRLPLLSTIFCEPGKIIFLI